EALERILASRTAPLPAGVPESRRAVWVCGSGLERNAALFSSLELLRPSTNDTQHQPHGGAPVIACNGLTCPDINALCLLARHGDYADEDIEPLYVRPCDAVENLPQLAPRQGLTGEEATTALADMLQRPARSDI
ncbi:MAG: tRNA (adenosine(37)-N6)-threonylcarbamoyltransferase complex dimerization subunit type 1 TsaB, partial [Desulfovibrio sp.]|nr:tRNA (adenosine(37)-N6)-threonylcarbamoyltransferase complex dimerization subunit type 1 TsaB [Desulfovibrio sp.]